MSTIMKKIISIFVLAITIVSLFSIKFNSSAETQTIKITVDEYYGHEELYESNDSTKYVLCGIIDVIMLQNLNYGIHAFRLKSINPLNQYQVDVCCKVDNKIGQDNATRYNGYYVYNGSLTTDSGKNKYIEIELDNSLFSSYVNDSILRGKVVCDVMDYSAGDLITKVTSQKENQVKSSMRFDYDEENKFSQSSCNVYTLVTSLADITEDGTYAFGTIYDEGKVVKFATPYVEREYQIGDKFPFSMERMNNNSFKSIYPDTYPATFKLSKTSSIDFFKVYYETKDENHLICEKGYYNNTSSGLFTFYNNPVIFDEGKDVYLFKFKETSSDNTPSIIKYDPSSVSIRFLSYYDYNTVEEIKTNPLVDDITFGMKLEIEGRNAQFVDFDAEEVARVVEPGSNVNATVDGVYQTVLKVKGIPSSSWGKEIKVTPYIKVSCSYDTPNDPSFNVTSSPSYIYLSSLSRTITDLAFDYYLNHGTESGVISHLQALKAIALKTAVVREVE